MTKNFCDICGKEVDTNPYYSITYDKIIKTAGMTLGGFPKEIISCKQGEIK